MSQNEELARQILTAYANGQVNLTNVPELQKIVKEAAAQQMASTYSTTDFHAKQAAALESEKAWYHQEITRILNEKSAALDTNQLQQRLTADFEQREQRLQDLLQQIQEQQDKLDLAVESSNTTSRKMFWRALMPGLFGFAVCLLQVAVIFFVLRSVLYQGVWNGLGLHKIYDTMIAIQPEHPYGAILLGIIGLLVIAGIIYASFLLLAKSVGYLTSVDPSKLLFWRKHKNHQEWR